MKKSRFNEEQIIAILKESEAGVPTGEVCPRPAAPALLRPQAYTGVWAMESALLGARIRTLPHFAKLIGRKVAFSETELAAISAWPPASPCLLRCPSQ